MPWSPRSPLKTSLIKAFTRHQMASLLATLLDYVCLFSMTELLNLHYTLATATGALVGAASNFLMNRYWAFKAWDEKWTTQSSRYLLVSAGSLLLNTAGVYALTETFNLHYATSVIIISMGVGVFFNFPLHKYYVYETPSTKRAVA
jgi:putative flippase GtrA